LKLKGGGGAAGARRRDTDPRAPPPPLGRAAARAPEHTGGPALSAPLRRARRTGAARAPPPLCTRPPRSKTLPLTPADLDAPVDPSALFPLPPASPLHLSSALAAFPSLSARAGGVGGRGLFAARALAARAELAREPAALWEAPGGAIAAAAALGSARALDAALLQMAPRALDAGARADARAPAAAVAPRGALALAALAANAFATRGGGRALFRVICLANSACDANAAAEEAPGGAPGDPPVYVLTARRAVAAGEELTVAYAPRAAPKAARRAALAAYGFACACARCAAPHDDTVVLKCAACGPRGRVFWPDAGRATACADCGAPRREPLPAGAAPGAPLAADADEPPAGAPAAALAAHADALLGAHQPLGAGDARVFAALARLLGAAAEGGGGGGGAEGAGGGEGAGEAAALAGEATALAALAARLAQALAEAALASGFTSLDDLGFEVEEG